MGNGRAQLISDAERTARLPVGLNGVKLWAACRCGAVHRFLCASVRPASVPSALKSLILLVHSLRASILRSMVPLPSRSPPRGFTSCRARIQSAWPPPPPSRKQASPPRRAPRERTESGSGPVSDQAIRSDRVRTTAAMRPTASTFSAMLPIPFATSQSVSSGKSDGAWHGAA